MESSCDGLTLDCVVKIFNFNDRINSSRTRL